MANDFRLTDSFIEEYKNLTPPFGDLGCIIYKTKYARPIYEENRLEEWWETIRRVVEGCYTIQKQHCNRLRLTWNHHKAAKSAQEMYHLMFWMMFLPPGRGLRNMGTDYMWDKTAACLYNCSGVSSGELSTDFAEPFCFLMDMSMIGTGVGCDLRGAEQVKIREPRQGDYTFIVEDSREGWVELIRTFLNAYVNKGSIPKEVDYSKVRPYGTPIKGLGGTASGPGVLQQLVIDISDILDPLIGEYITSTAIADLFSAIARCVVSGNLRRSALLLLGDPDDEAFLNLKNPEINQERLNKWRWTGNNSVIATIGMDYTKVAKLTVTNGEPGYFWIENASQYGRMKDLPIEGNSSVLLINPCGEIPGENQFACNVPETFPARHKNIEDYKRTLKYAYLYAKSVSLLPTHRERTNVVQLMTHRLGISQSGIAQNINIRGYREHMKWCDEGYQYLRQTDKIYSKWLCVTESVCLTSVKPGGSIPLLCGATPGVHYPFSRYYLRAMRFDKKSPIVKSLKETGYTVEDDVVDESSVVVYFSIEEKDFYRARKDLSVWEQAELVAQMQYWWSDNAVSATLTFKPEEAKDIQRILSSYETRFKSISFLPLQDHNYKQAPYQKITKTEYKKAIKKLKPFNFNNIGIEKYNQKEYCSSDRCEIT